MRKLFGRKSFSGSENRTAFNRRQNSPSHPDSQSEEYYEDPPVHENTLVTSQSLPEVDTLSLNSVPLSEAETLTLTRDQCLHLQDTYHENFTSYIPYLVRRLRAETEGHENPNFSEINNTPREEQDSEAVWGSEGDSDDDRTMVSEPETPPLMHRYTTDYNYKRTLIVASELIRTNTYVFPDAESFELFKQLRSTNKKLRKNSIVLYDENSNIRRIYSRRNTTDDVVSGSKIIGLPLIPDSRRSSNQRPLTGPVNMHVHGSRTPLNSERRPNLVLGEPTQSRVRETLQPNPEIKLDANSDLTEANGQKFSKDRFSRCTIDSRPHIIPLDYKVKGKGLPVFKIVVPYMSTFRRKTPYMIFRKYIEKPKPPKDSDTIEDEQFETYDFCTVHLKNFQHYKRYTFIFQPLNGPSFKVLAFQNNYRPFTDFNYKDTRFRIFGTPITMAYLTHYNPQLKLHILDKNQPSLLDNIVDKKNDGDIFARGKKQKDSENSESLSRQRDIQEFENPTVNPNNVILRQNIDGSSATYHSFAIPHENPPFGRFLDACAYLTSTPLLPKKYSEVGKVDLYQDPRDMASADRSSSLAVDLDSLVLTTVFLALRETNLRTTVKHPGHSHSKISLLTSIALNAGGTNQAALV